MRKDTLRSLKSHRKDFLLVLVGMLLIYVVVAVILITNAGGGMREIFNHFWPFNEDNIWAYGLTFFIILTAIMYIYALVKEKVFLSKGTKYKGEIVDVIEKSNWRGRGTYVYYLIVKYNDSEQFTSGPYMDNPFFCLENMECVVYKWGNKCYPSDFNMKKDRDVRI